MHPLRMRRLLTHLAQFSVFSRQGELLCTRALEFLLEDASLREAFTRHVWSDCPVELAGRLRWRAELRQRDGGRPDLEATTSEGVPVVKVEAKLGAALTKAQLLSYADDLHVRGSDHGVLVVLVPRYRVMEARASLLEARIEAPITANVCVWEDVIGAFERAASEPVAGDLAQFSAMYRVLSGDDVEPLADEQALRAWRDRETAFVTYVDRATPSSPGGTSGFPSTCPCARSATWSSLRSWPRR